MTALKNVTWYYDSKIFKYPINAKLWNMVILRAQTIREYGEALISKTKCLPGCKLFNHHKHLKLGLLLFQLIYGPYQDFYDLNLLQNTYQRTSHNFLFIFNHSKCDMMLVVLLKFTGVSTTGCLLSQYLYVVTSVF